MSNLINQLIKELKTTSLENFEANLLAYNEVKTLISNKVLTLNQTKEAAIKLAASLKLEELLKSTNYIEPVYPDMGISGENGSCIFSSKEEAEALISILINQSYYYGHKLKYTGPGKYIIKPDYSFDHDGEVIYTAVYERKTL
jgi:hypothetical protein